VSALSLLLRWGRRGGLPLHFHPLVVPASWSAAAIAAKAGNPNLATTRALAWMAHKKIVTGCRNQTTKISGSESVSVSTRHWRFSWRAARPQGRSRYRFRFRYRACQL